MFTQPCLVPLAPAGIPPQILPGGWPYLHGDQDVDGAVEAIWERMAL